MTARYPQENESSAKTVMTTESPTARSLPTTTRNARYVPGQIVRHRRFDYRGVIVDVDPDFQGSEQWYEEMAKSRPPKDRPWYHVLVDQADTMTYVAERHLDEDPDDSPIEHPMLEDYLGERLADGRYAPRHTMN